MHASLPHSRHHTHPITTNNPPSPTTSHHTSPSHTSRTPTHAPHPRQLDEDPRKGEGTALLQMLLEWGYTPTLSPTLSPTLTKSHYSSQVCAEWQARSALALRSIFPFLLSPLLSPSSLPCSLLRSTIFRRIRLLLSLTALYQRFTFFSVDLNFALAPSSPPLLFSPSPLHLSLFSHTLSRSPVAPLHQQPTSGTPLATHSDPWLSPGSPLLAPPWLPSRTPLSLFPLPCLY